ncbi:MAG: hypothetical protein R2698_07115 [Microthrixaceae bacterium]
MPTPGGPTSVNTVPYRRSAGARDVGGAFVGVLAALDAELADRELLDDAVLHVAEPVVVGVEHLARRGEVEVILGAFAPRQFEDGVDPGSDPAHLG